MQSTFESPARWRRLRAVGRFGLVVLAALTTFSFLIAGIREPRADRRNSPDLSASATPASPTVTPVAVAVSLEMSLERSAKTHESALRSESGLAAESAQNKEFARQWRSHLDAQGLQAAPPADWLTVCRRLSLALVGTGLSLEEIRNLEAIPEDQRVHQHRERLLRSGRFHHYWAERTTRFLVGADEGPFLVYRRRRFRTWLAEEFAANRRYDELVRSLITARGLWTDEPEVNFYTVTYDSGDGKPDPIRLAARTTRAFLGIRIDCLQCHDDFLGNVSLGDPLWMNGDDQFRGGTQQDFHSLAAFFTAAKANGLQGIRDGAPDYKTRYLDADADVDVQPQVPYRRDLLPPRGEKQGSAPEHDTEATSGSDRERLAAWLTHPENKQTARAAVVRVWTLLFGRPPGPGDFAAVDDLPLDQTGHPMIATLTDAFIDGGYDMRQLIRWITDSPAFTVDSVADFEITRAHEDAWAVFPVVRLRGEQVAGAALQAARIKTIDRDSSFIVQLQMFGGRNDFLERYGDLGEDEFRGEAITLTQRLTLLNGELVDESSAWNPILNATSHAAMFAGDDASAVRALYLSVLNRPPTDVERDHFVTQIQDADDREEAFVDVVWVLFNSSEFAWNH